MFVGAKLDLALLFEISFKETAVINGQSQPFWPEVATADAPVAP